MYNLPIGILGGTFDPIHLGHIHLANTVLTLYDLQKILLIPCNQSPLRNQPVTTANDRFNMVNLAIANIDKFFADDREIKRPGLSYTVDTLKSLHQENKNTPLAFIIGIDAFNKFDEWRDSQKILEFAHLLIANRPGFWQVTNKKANELLKQRQIIDPQQLRKKRAGLIYLANVNPLAISATEVRCLIKELKDIKKLVAPEVWKYICEKQLYT